MDETSDVSADLGLYVTAAGGLVGAWHAAGGREVDGFGDAALTVLAAVAGAFAGLLLGLLVGVAVLVIHTVAVAPAVGWWRHRRFGPAALVVVAWALVIAALLWRWPDRFLTAALIVGFGGWSVCLARQRFGESSHLAVRAVPHLGGVAVTTLVGEQLVFGNLLSTTYVAPVLLLIMVWLSWCGWRAMRAARRVSVRAAADIVWSIQLGLLLSLTLVWLAAVLALTPSQVTAIRAVLERVQALTAVHWGYWLAAYTALAVGSFLVLGWPQRFRETRLPIFGLLTTGKRALAGINIGLMVTLVFAIAAVPVATGAWLRQVEERYALEMRHIQRTAGEAAAYEEIRQYVTANRRVAARLAPIVVAVHEAAPTDPGQPVSNSARGIARHLGRFQAATVDLEDTSNPDSAKTPSPARTAELPGDQDVSEAFGVLDEAQQDRSLQVTRASRFADAAAAAVASALDIPDVGRNEVVHILKAYLGGLVEEGRLRDLFRHWAQDGSTPPELSRLVSVDLPALHDAAYDLTRTTAIRAGVDVWTFNATYGLGITMPGETPEMAEIVILARQNHHLTDSSSPCPGCVHPPEGGDTQPGGGTSGGGRRG